MCQELPQRDPILNTNGLDINLMGPQNQITPWLDKGAVFAMNAMDFFLTIHRPFSFSNVFCTLSPLYVFFSTLYFPFGNKINFILLQNEAELRVCLFCFRFTESI